MISKPFIYFDDLIYSDLSNLPGTLGAPNCTGSPASPNTASVDSITISVSTNETFTFPTFGATIPNVNFSGSLERTSQLGTFLSSSVDTRQGIYPGHQHYFKMLWLKGSESSAYSDVIKFVAEPWPVLTLSPSGNCLVDDPNPIVNFGWTQLPTRFGHGKSWLNYQFQISSNANFSSFHTNVIQAGCMKTVSMTLGTWYIRVRVKKDYVGSYYSPWYTSSVTFFM